MNRRVVAAEVTGRTEVRHRNPPPHVGGYGSRREVWFRGILFLGFVLFLLCVSP